MKKCLFCSAEVSKDSKICPNCGKRCLSRKWLILIFIVAVILVFGIFGSNNDNNQDQQKNHDKVINENNNQATEKPKEEKSYKLQEPVIINTTDGSYKLTITGITETNDRNEFSGTKADRVILVSYAYENIDYSDNLYIFESHFKVYDSNNQSLETYPSIETKSGESISMGRKTDGIMAFALNNDKNYIELEYYDNMFNDKYDTLFKIEW